ncbi:Prenylcysteine lyase-domain-containing protein [Pyronema omphalodes]|nr:Prenylcysteine lyase-domain-containing protein [Pyronema omphalodes]
MRPPRLPLTHLLLLLSLCLLATAASASVFNSILKKLPSFKQEPYEGRVVATQGLQDVAGNKNKKNVKNVKRDGKRVAVVGAGAAGASTAYHLRRFLGNSTVSSVPVNITVFDKHTYIGGRSTTVNAYNDAAIPIELGASIFVEVNSILYGASQELGLSFSGFSASSRRVQGESNDVLGVFNGHEMLFTYPEGRWWSLMKLVYRYGATAPWRTRGLMQSVVGKFLNLYKAPIFPFKSLTAAIEEVGLKETVGLTGEQLLESAGISGPFATELIQASTRVNYGQNLGLIHGVETMVCMATDGAVSIAGGNWKIFQGMLNKSRADVKLRTPVTSIVRRDGEWAVTYATDGEKSQTEVFDEVVVAAPMQYAGLDITPELENKPDTIPYVTLHVTLFASPRKLDPVYFGLPEDAVVPQSVLTTLNATEQQNPLFTRGEGRNAAGSVGFFSVSTLRSVERGNRTEYIYKVFSPDHYGDDKVRRILGVAPESEEEVTTWSYRHTWKSYPYEYPRVTFEEVKLASGVWYTAGMESFISTMETSALMGMNVAKLVIGEWEDAKAAEDEKERVRLELIAQAEAEAKRIEEERVAAEKAARLEAKIEEVAEL